MLSEKKVLSRQQKIPIFFTIPTAKNPTTTKRIVSTLRTTFMKCWSRNSQFHRFFMISNCLDNCHYLTIRKKKEKSLERVYALIPNNYLIKELELEPSPLGS